MEEINLTPELYFLRYSLPCLEALYTQGRVTEKQKNSIEKKFFSSQEIKKEEIKNIFVEAIRRLKESAKKSNLEYWSIDAIRKYFLEAHNKYIEKGDGMYSKVGSEFKELCKVKIGIVKEVDPFVIVVCNHDELKALNVYDLSLKKGDLVSVHWKTVVEKL